LGVVLLGLQELRVQLGDPCLLTHQMGYCPDADLLVAERLGAVLPAPALLLQLALLGFPLLDWLAQLLLGLL
jgi:hypothetical protein